MLSTIVLAASLLGQTTVFFGGTNTPDPFTSPIPTIQINSGFYAPVEVDFPWSPGQVSGYTVELREVSDFGGTTVVWSQSGGAGSLTPGKGGSYFQTWVYPPGGFDKRDVGSYYFYITGYTMPGGSFFQYRGLFNVDY